LAITATKRASTIVSERRSRPRHTMVLRVGLLETQGRSAFCLLRNISSRGVQVKIYAPLSEGAEVRLRVGDEDSLEGQIAWVRDGVAGIQFRNTLAPGTLLRVRQKIAASRRRSSPRVSIAVCATLATGGHTCAVQLCDISTTGARIRGRKPLEAGGSASLMLPQLSKIRAHVRWAAGLDAGLVFEAPIPLHRLTEWLHVRLVGA
jgi:hypothetical protein